MTKRIISFLLILVLSAFCATAALADDTFYYMQDIAEIVDDAKEAELDKKLESISEKYGMTVAVITVFDLEGVKIDDYAYDIYNILEYGEDGVLLLYSEEDNEACILPVGYGKTAFTNAGKEYIFDEIASEMKAKNYDAAFDEFADICDEFIGLAKDGKPFEKRPFDSAMAAVISIIIGFVFAFIATGSMKGQLKSVRMQKAAANYQRNGSLSLINSTDYFLYSKVDRQKKETNNSSTGSHGSSIRKF